MYILLHIYRNDYTLTDFSFVHVTSVTMTQVTVPVPQRFVRKMSLYLVAIDPTIIIMIVKKKVVNKKSGVVDYEFYFV